MPSNHEPVDPAGVSPWQSVGFLLSTLGYAVSRGFHQTLAPVGLEPRQFLVLRTIGLDAGRSQQQLAQRLQIPKSRMVAIVDELEQRGLLERRPDPADRRVHALHLTPEGQTVLRAAFQLALQHEQRVSGSLEPEERAQLLDLLGRVATALDLPERVHSALRDHS